MKPLRLVLPTILLLLPASRIWSLDAFYGVNVCNDGQLVVEVARAVKYHGDWEIGGWTRISPGQCELAYWGPFERMEFWGGSHAHLAFAFTDSTGVWGAAEVKVEPHWWSDALSPSDVSICVRKQNFQYSLKGGDPAAACSRDPRNSFLIPASINWSPGIGQRLDFHVARGSKDRAIQLGPQLSTGEHAPAAPPTPSVADQLENVFRRLHGAAASLERRYRRPRCPEVRWNRTVQLGGVHASGNRAKRVVGRSANCKDNCTQECHSPVHLVACLRCRQ